MCLPDRFIDHGAQRDQLEDAGLTDSHIAATALKMLGRSTESLGVLSSKMA